MRAQVSRVRFHSARYHNTANVGGALSESAEQDPHCGDTLRPSDGSARRTSRNVWLPLNPRLAQRTPAPLAHSMVANSPTGAFVSDKTPHRPAGRTAWQERLAAPARCSTMVNSTGDPPLVRRATFGSPATASRPSQACASDKPRPDSAPRGRRSLAGVERQQLTSMCSVGCRGHRTSRRGVAGCGLVLATT